MSAKTDLRLSPSQRLARGLKYTAMGPVDVTRGALGLGIDGAQSSAAWVNTRYRRARVSDQLAAAQEAVANLPSTLQKERGKRRRRPLLLVAAGAVVLAGGAVTFSIIRRSSKPEPSPLPPSVEVAPRP